MLNKRYSAPLSADTIGLLATIYLRPHFPQTASGLSLGLRSVIGHHCECNHTGSKLFRKLPSNMFSWSPCNCKSFSSPIYSLNTHLMLFPLQEYIFIFLSLIRSKKTGYWIAENPYSTTTTKFRRKTQKFVDLKPIFVSFIRQYSMNFIASLWFIGSLPWYNNNIDK